MSCFIQQSCWESCDSLKSSSESHDENTGSSDDTVIAGRVLLRGSVEAQCLALTREFSKTKKLGPIAIFEETYLIVWSYLKRTSGYLRMSVKPSNTFQHLKTKPVYPRSADCLQLCWWIPNQRVPNLSASLSKRVCTMNLPGSLHMDFANLFRVRRCLSICLCNSSIIISYYYYHTFKAWPIHLC